MILIKQVTPYEDFTIEVIFEDNTVKKIDLTPYLHGPAFKSLNNFENFKRIINHGYYIEWLSGQDLSSDTLYFG